MIDPADDAPELVRRAIEEMNKRAVPDTVPTEWVPDDGDDDEDDDTEEVAII